MHEFKVYHQELTNLVLEKHIWYYYNAEYTLKEREITDDAWAPYLSLIKVAVALHLRGGKKSAFLLI